MKSRLATFTAVLLCLLSTSALLAGEVTVSSVHLCCGKCLKAAGGALNGVDGVSNVKCDRSSSTVTYSAASDDAAKAGVDALAKAGFGGSAKHGEKAVAFPSTGAKKGASSNSLTFSGVHLCCGKCVTAAEKAVKNVSGVNLVKVDKDAGTVTLSGKDISATAASDALLASGFFGKVK